MVNMVYIPLPSLHSVLCVEKLILINYLITLDLTFIHL